MKSLYIYTNYRLFLADFYTFHKASEGGFSWRIFAKKAGFGSPIFLKQVIDGLKNLSTSSIDRVAQAIELNDEERVYFHALVSFTHAESDHERNFHFARMSSVRQKKGITLIGDSEYEYFSHWFIPVIREVIAGKPITLDIESVGNLLNPPISRTDTEYALNILQSIGYITSHNGFWKQTSPLLATSPEVHSLGVRNYHDQMLTHASTALRELPRHERSISGLILQISPDGYKGISERIDAFREELLQMAACDTDVDRVYQVGIQIFPVSRGYK